MSARTPDALIDTLVQARNAGDVDTALACYEPDATIVAQPGDVKSGSDGVRGVLEYFISLRPTFAVGARTILTTGDLASHLSSWSLHGTDPAGAPVALTGQSSDVFRKQPDGTWLIAIDNPWGTQLVAD